MSTRRTPDPRPVELEVSGAVLCPDCWGEWCPSCDWTGLSLPRRLATVTTLPVRAPATRGVAA